ncbi:hypothetical protein C8J56DRAFT_1045330 [Mycena floridula]|nr:hypothetical protein C8J56DRAFT_1045330 [Mycena floridula]
MSLKEEGNKLFAQQDFVSASVKYTEALAVDPENPILFSNRAACLLQMGQYMDAKADCIKATTLDPLYARAWARMGSCTDALGEWEQSTLAWQNALNVLPKDNLSPLQAKQKLQYTESFKAAEEKFAKVKLGEPPSHAIQATMEMVDLMPAKVAERMLPDLMAQNNPNSIAWVLQAAYKDYKTGLDTMKAIKVIKTGNLRRLEGTTGAIQDMTNGILRDMRVFYMDHGWQEAFERQWNLEAAQKRLWLTAGPELIMEEALVRQRNEGWGSVRPALSSTIRSCHTGIPEPFANSRVRHWIMRGFLNFRVKQSPTSSVEYLGRSLEVLNWGRQVWKAVPTSDRGAIFDPTFVRGVHSLYVTALMEASRSAASTDIGNMRALEDLYDAAQDLAREAQANPFNPINYPQVDTGFQHSFFGLPLANALAAKGFYHIQLATKAKKERNFAQSKEHQLSSADFYLQAADSLPPDDEDHPWFLKCALTYMGPYEPPLRTSLALMQRIRESLPKMRRIWQAHPAMGKRERNPAYKKIAQEEITLRKLLAEGKLKMDKKVALQGC